MEELHTLKHLDVNCKFQAEEIAAEPAAFVHETDHASRAHLTRSFRLEAYYPWQARAANLQTHWQ